MMSRASVPLLLIMRGGPAAVQDRCVGIFMKALLQENRAAVAPVDVTFAATLLGHRRDAAETLQARRAGEAFPFRTHAGQKPRGQYRSRSGQTGEDLPIGMFAEDLH